LSPLKHLQIFPLFIFFKKKNYEKNSNLLTVHKIIENDTKLKDFKNLFFQIMLDSEPHNPDPNFVGNSVVDPEPE
jgi:hypothetical protein